MSNSSGPRVRRGPPPKKPLRRTTYGRALPELLRDFEGRCAYCRRHLPSRGPRFIEIDHFDPREKKAFIQRYANLFLADRECNGKKRDIWPSQQDQSEGTRFLNCCDEMDYDEQIVENPATHELIGLTRAARFHIRILDLNASHLVIERARRHRFRQLLDRTPLFLRSGAPAPMGTIDELRHMIDEMIPPIRFANSDEVGGGTTSGEPIHG